MKTLLTDELIENTYLYCWKRLANKDDARDIAQEIVIDAMIVLRSDKKIDNFYGLYWSIANHKITDFYRRKRIVKISLDDVENVLLGFDKSLGDYVRQEEVDNLAKSMNRLASIHRDILVRFYVKGQSVKEISSALSIPTGTVTKRLSDARKKLKENFEDMENQKEEKSESKIQDYYLSFRGAAYNAYEAVSGLLDRQILLVCREIAKTVTEIANEVEAPPVFVEEAVHRLVKVDLMFEKEKEKFLTDFIFIPKTVDYEAICRAKKIAGEIKFQERYLEILNGMKEEILAEDFYGNNFDWEYLLPYFIIRSNREFKRICSGDYIREKYITDHYDRIWRNYFAIGYYGEEPEGDPDKENIIGPGYKYEKYYDSKCGYFEVHNTIDEMKFTRNGKDYELTIDRLNWLNGENFSLYKKIIDNPNVEISEKEEEYLADFLSKGIIVKTSAGYKGSVPVVSFELMDKWCKSWSEKFQKLAIEISEALYQDQKDFVLPHIRKDLRFCSTWNYFPVFFQLDSLLMEYAIDKGIVRFEEGTNNSCVSMVVVAEKF